MFRRCTKLLENFSIHFILQVDEIVLDIVGKEIVEGLPEEDSIQALERVEQQLDVDGEESPEIQAVVTPRVSPKRRRNSAQVNLTFLNTFNFFV
jgi:hypothetical protein